MNNRLIISFAVIIMVCLSSCEKGPGAGGTSSIRGKVITREYDGDFIIMRDEYPAVKEDVFIIYGDDFVYADKFETDYEGEYEFKYLREGNYTVYVYSKDSTNHFTDEKIAVVREVEITGKDQIVEVPDMIILK